ncbi:MAG: sigma-54 dependent transcriptional regulator [Acidobacteriota bacterium]
MKARLLIVDDEPRMAAAIVQAMSRSGYECEACQGGEQALAAFQRDGADLVLTDVRMPGIDGLELLRRLLALQPGLPVILITAHGGVRSAVDAIRQGAFDYITKPFDNAELRSLVDRALTLDRLQRENRWLRRELGVRHADGVVCESPAMKRALQMAERAAGSKAAVLIQGGSGTGKEVVARHLHRTSDRASGPFVAVNCRAFAEGVLESELFGHEKGAFTGAQRARPGCFERADGGTLLLDEIGEVDAGFQAKILRVLQEEEVQRVGSDQPRPVDTRVVAATNRNLTEEMRAGRFREDLYFRLNVIPIHLPPLRERREDVLPLARHFLARHATDGGRVLTLSPQAEEALLAHPWPGNVRELENAIQRAVVLARSGVVGTEDLLLDGLGAPGAVGPTPSSLQEYLDAATVQAIRSALDQVDGRRAAAAELLGIDRTTLYRLTKRHRL